MHSDSMIVVHSLKDTLKILSVNNTSQSLNLVTLLAVLLGGSISIAGNYFLARRQTRIEIHKAFFTKHFEVVSKLTEIAQKGFTVTVHDVPTESRMTFPQAYFKFAVLIKWLNSLVNHIDQSRIYIDSRTSDAFYKLNHKVLEDLTFIRAHSDNKTKDIVTRERGRQSVGEVQTLTRELISSCKTYIKKAYNVKLPSDN